ncbi:MAG: YtxH domain-containing protein [Myxococcota bacterium]|jgi:gas vesicle protein|nr:YtxH domain-containing protein [Myxococcota bacterium]
MSHHNTYGAGHLILAALGGALVGASVAILVTPKSGRETREQIVEVAKKAVKRIPRPGHRNEAVEFDLEEEA